MIINLRGTHGSGKSYAMRNFLKAHQKIRMVYGLLGNRLPEAYELRVEGVDRPVYVLGSYVTTCGGCDLIEKMECVIDLIKKYEPKGHVVFEGLLLSGVYGAVGTALEAYGKQYLSLFLNTSLEVSIERVRQRRTSSGRRDDTSGFFGDEGKFKFNPHNVKKKFDSVILVKKRMLRDKIFRVQSVSSDGAPDRIANLLRKANGTVAQTKQSGGGVGGKARVNKAQTKRGHEASVD